METQLTRKMKQGLVGFKLEMPTQMRTPRYAEEVWTSSGIVDFIRFEDYKESEDNWCAKIDYNKLTQDDLKCYKSISNDSLGFCKIEGEDYPNKNCQGCIYHKTSYKVGMLVTCFECKITVSDFKSSNGHNFHGNRNYYVVPKEIYQDIKDLVPEEIGIIVYYEKSGRYKMMKECKWKDIDDKLKCELLYNAFKKWVDRCCGDYWQKR